MDREENTELVSLLEEQRDLCVRLSEMVHTQRRLVTRDDPSRLMALLADRQRLTDALRDVCERIGDPTVRMNEMRVRGATAEIATVEALRAEVSRRLGEVLRADEEDGKKLLARKEQARSAMSEVGKGQAALAAYRGAQKSRGPAGDREG